LISFLNVSVKYDKNHGTALNKVNLDVDGGKVVVVGANGSGKTTMIKVLLGLAPLTSGKVMVGDDHNRDLRDFTELGTNLQ
jgi:ABC-type multidrug transport system fused ATPase/permease subunit